MTTQYFAKFDREHIESAICNWLKSYPESGIVAFVAESSADRVSDLQKTTKQCFCPMVGAIFPSLIVDGDIKKTGILLIMFEKMPVFSLLPELENISSTAAAELITKSVSIANDSKEQSVLMLFDGMLPNIATVIDAIYLEWGDDVNYMGANAGSGTFQSMPCLFDNYQIVGNAALILLMPAHAGAILSHGYQHLDNEMPATATTGNCVSMIDWRPAFDVYRDIAREQYGLDINETNFYEFAVHYPLGIMKADGQVLIRIPVALGDDGALYCVGEVPENAMLTLMKAIPENAEDTIDVISEYVENNSSQDILLFYCAGRQMHLGDDTMRELHKLNERVKPKAVMGAFSLGEIGGSKHDKYPLFHNATIVAIPL